MSRFAPPLVGLCSILLSASALLSCASDPGPSGNETSSEEGEDTSGEVGGVESTIPTGDGDAEGGDGDGDGVGDGDGDGDVDPDPDDDAAYIYDQSQFHTYELLIEEADLAFLNSNPTAEQYVPGYLVFEGEQYGPVGIRYKGSLGSWIFCTEASTPQDPFAVGGAKTCPKLNMKVSFNWSDPEGRFYGLKKLLFHAMNQDPAMMRERMGYRLFREMGVPAPRAVHNRLLINGVYAGVFLNVEYVDGRFTRSHYTDGKGNLYKEVWPTFSELQPVTTAQTLLAALRTNEDEMPSVQKMLDFGAAVMESTGQARADVIDTWMDSDNVMRMVAVDRTIRADDGLFHFYCAGNECDNHNFYIYEEADADKVWVIPWDLDNSFNVYEGGGEFGAEGFIKIVDEWNDTSVPCVPHPGAIEYTPEQMPPHCDPLIGGWSSFTPNYETQVGDLLEGPFSEATVDQWISQWDAQVRAAVEEAYALDPLQASVAQWESGMSDFRSKTQILRDQAAANIGR